MIGELIVEPVGTVGTLDSIDAVLNELLMRQRNANDVRRGFNPARDYTKRQLRRFDYPGIELFRRLGDKACFALIRVSVTEGTDPQTGLYLRGFEMPFDTHPSLAMHFVSKELMPVFPELLGDFSSWPVKDGADCYERVVDFENGGIKLSVEVIGGARYAFGEKSIFLTGRSGNFGPIPPDSQQELIGLMRQLAQRPAYHGSKIYYRYLDGWK
ncbi:hypothetical protein HYX09_02085 [Candidatus Woesearchaeota archaeon]|nr:hypothetical protein [Candidatus Woesearchaeota archaeon]